MSTVLIVDDAALGRTTARLALTRAGHIVLEAPDGERGLALAEAHRPDVIVAAAAVPVLDADGLLAGLTGRDLHIPVVVVEQEMEPAHRRRLLERGATAVVRRDVDPRPLLEAVHRALDARLAA